MLSSKMVKLTVEKNVPIIIPMGKAVVTQAVIVNPIRNYQFTIRSYNQW